jgi:hypothetical protein
LLFLGIYNGLLVRLKGDNHNDEEEEEQELNLKRPWLITIHCISHRFELALKDSLLNNKLNKTTADVRDFLISLFYLFKKSPKLSRMMKATGNTMDVQPTNSRKYMAHALWLICDLACEPLSMTM